MEILKTTIEQSSRTDEFSFRLMGDFHIGSSGFDEDGLRRDIKEITNHPNCMVFCMGDYIENTPVTHKNWDPEHLDRNLMLPEEQYDLALEVLEPLRGRILGFIDGEHDQRTVPLTGHSWTRYLCREFDAAYLGETAIARVQFKRVHEKRSWDFYLSHGRSRSTKGGAVVNKLTDLGSHWGADIFAMGGAHYLKTWKEAYLYLNNAGTLEARERAFASTGSYLKSYEVGKKSYAEPKQYNPLIVGSPTLTITPSTGELVLSE